MNDLDAVGYDHPSIWMADEPTAEERIRARVQKETRVAMARDAGKKGMTVDGWDPVTSDYSTQED